MESCGAGVAIRPEHYDAFLYGAGDHKIGTIVKLTLEEAKDLITEKPNMADRAVKRLQKEGITNPNEISVARVLKGAAIKQRFIERTPGLLQLREAVQQRVAEVGYLRGLDGRILSIRSVHSALNTLLQSAGAVIMKQATVLLYKEMAVRGLLGGLGQFFNGALFYPGAYDDYQAYTAAFVHDEWQIMVKEGRENEVAEIALESIRRAGEVFKFRCTLAGETKIGKTWFDTH